VDAIFDLALRHNCKRRISQIYCIIGTYNYWVEEDVAKAFNHLEKALEISEEIKDNVSGLLASYYLGFALAHDCEFKKSAHYIEKANRINVAANSLWGISTMKSTLSYNACNQGDINNGYKTSAEAIRIAEESGDIFSKAAAYISHGISCVFKGFIEEAINSLSKGADFSARINHFYQGGIAHDWLGESYLELGEYRKSRYHYHEAITKKEHGKLPRSWINLSKICLERAKVINDKCDIDLESLYRYEADNKIRLYDGWMRRALSEILLKIDGKHILTAEVWLSRAIEADKENGTIWFLGRDYTLYSELLKLKGRVSEAKEYLSKAIETFEVCGADEWRKKGEKRLASIS
jgi:tetratricopeptide (TPR) repeat protein